MAIEMESIGKMRDATATQVVVDEVVPGEISSSPTGHMLRCRDQVLENPWLDTVRRAQHRL